MATSIKDQAGVFTKAVNSRRIASRKGLIQHYVFGTDFATSSINWAGGPPLTVVAGNGVPAYGPGYTEVSSLTAVSAGFQTSVYAETDMTLMAVWCNRNSTGKCPPLWISSGGYSGFVQAVGNNVIDVYNMQSGVGASVADMTMPASNSYYFVAARLPAAGFGELYKGVDTAGVLSLAKATAEVAGGPANNQSRKTATWQIATVGAGQGQTTVPIRIAEIAVWKRLMTEAEILETYRRQKVLRLGTPITLL